MNSTRILLALLIMAVAPLPASAVSDAELFTWAAVAYPQYFSGTPSAGQYLQYDYRYYPATHNYLGVDDRGEVFVLGPVSKNTILDVGPVSKFAPAALAWEATQPGTKLLIQAWNPDGSPATISDFVTHTHYITSAWDAYENYGVFPLGMPPATAQLASDISSANINGVNYIQMDLPTSQAFYFTALWTAPVIGTVFMRADNAGAGYVVGGGQPLMLELPYAFAVSEYARAQQLLPTGTLSPEAQGLLTQATAAMNATRSAATPAARAAAAYTALSFIMPLKERLVLDASNTVISSVGVRTDFDLNFEGFGSWTNTAFLPQYTDAKSAGFRSVLTNVGWTTVSPTQGTYDFTALDYQISQAIQLGFKVALNINTNIGSMPAWVSTLSFNDLKTLYYENARTVVARYGSNVSWYYPASELELQRGSLTTGQLAELAQQSLAGARAASPGTLFGIYVSASSYVSYQMNLSANPTYISGFNFIRYLTQSGIRFDFLGLEMQYGTTFAPVDLQRFQEVLQDVYRVAGIPIYMGETGYSSKAEDYGIAAPFYWHNGFTQQSQADWADGTLRMLYALPFVKGYYWVHLDPDNNDYGSTYLSSLLGTGIVRADGTPKKSCAAFQNFNSQLAKLVPGSAGAPFSVTMTGGTGQSAIVNAAFASTLQVLVRDYFGNAVPNVTVSFTAPPSGASGVFQGHGQTAAVTTSSQGVALAPAFTANSTVGSYTVTASVTGVAASAGFALSNIP